MDDVESVLTHALLGDRDRIRYLIFSHDGKRLVSITEYGAYGKTMEPG